MKSLGLGTAALLLLVACGDDVMPMEDASTGACDRACDDGLYCNGEERCDPEDASADADGCVAGTPPCSGECDEDADSCEGGECPEPDADGDGVDSIACGGDDCDDDDPDRFPGNLEICDEDGHDEDCDDTTFGADEDADGFQDDDCCNGDACGTDCDDARGGVNPGAVDACGGGDEDCDGDIDEEPDSTFFRDEDNDNYGVDDDTLEACSQPSGYTTRGGDCQDDPFENPDSNEFNPGASEICNELDDDCDMAIDEGLECACTVPGMERDCGFDPALDGTGICRLGTQTCVDGSYTTCVGATPPTDETCNLADDDCDGDIDEGVILTCYDDPDGDGYAVVGAASSTDCSCPVGTTSVDPAVSEDCDEGDAMIHPGATERCNRLDDDCSSGGGALIAEDRDNDGHTPTGFAGCTGGFPKDDCNDRDARVYPGQTAYQTSPSCPEGTCVCGTACEPRIGFSCRFCTGDEQGSVAGDWDFNCDGTESRVPAGSCLCRTGFACPGDVPSYSGTPACGSDVTMNHCGTGGCGSCSGASSPTQERLGCR